jgi:hypothetical protein
VKLDYRTRRGIALGFDSEIHYGKEDHSVAKITSYYLQDQNPDLNRTSLPRSGTPTSRYRFLDPGPHPHHRHSGGDRRNDQTERYLSCCRTFSPTEFRVNPQAGQPSWPSPKTSPFYTLDGLQPFSSLTLYRNH